MSFINKWKDKIAHYVEVRLDLIKLGFIERTSGILSYLIFVFICFFLSLSVLIFIGIGIGEYFAMVFDSRVGGFFVTAGFYLLLMVLMFLLRVPITNFFSGLFIRILTENDEEEDKTKNDIKVE
jgi:hypothetical protein